MSLQSTEAKQLRTAVILLFVLTSLIASLACKRSNTTGNTSVSNSNTANGSAANVAGDIFSPPPFSTKEPERYQATMVITGNMGDKTPSVPGLSGVTNNQMSIARDGDKRRVDYEIFPGVKMSYLQLPNGHFILSSIKKIYAEINPKDLSRNLSDPTKSITSDFSPERLKKESRTEVNYEKVGTEEVNGRTTTKYRVTTTGKIDPAIAATSKPGEAQNVTTETLVWVDESLGMPIKSETTQAGGAASGSKYTTELRDIKQDVDPTLFEMPQGYKKVDYKDLFTQMLSSSSNLFGKEKDENAKPKKK